MLLGLVAMAAVLAMGAWLSGRCQANASAERPYRLESGPGLVVYCGPRGGPILGACPYLFAGGGGIFIIGALWLGWREGRTERPKADANQATNSKRSGSGPKA
jgi:hypothetical protein